MDEPLSLEYVERIGAVVAVVDYRKAPESPYPGSIEDCYDSFMWFYDHATEFGVNTNRIAVLGHSAGGNLATALALMVRDRKGPKIAFLMPCYPMLDDRCLTPSSQEFTDRRVWNKFENKTAWKMYLGDMDRSQVPVYAAPGRAKDLSGLPPVYIAGDQEPFRDEIIEFVAKLVKTGVPTEFHLCPGYFHAFEGMFPMRRCPFARRRTISVR